MHLASVLTWMLRRNAVRSYISNVEVNPRLEGEWMPIDLAATYTVFTNSFISSGWDGYIDFSKAYALLLIHT